jgi:Zn-finger nucleic acid-binding protein
MNCPTCRTVVLHPIQLEPTLGGRSCAQCHGISISSADYWAWLASQPALPGQVAIVEETLEVADVARAKLCPHCGHLQLSYRIALDLGFRLDQCGHCNSFWFDGGEWNALRLRGLHAQCHRVTGEAWQRRLRDEASRRAWDAIYVEKFGAPDYAEAQRVRSWLQQHPARQMLLAFLCRDDA